jgi:hypothetical protein
MIVYHIFFIFSQEKIMKVRIVNLFILIIGMLLMTPLGTLSAEPLQLKYKFNKEQILNYKCSINQQMEIFDPINQGMSQKISIKVGMNMHQKVLAIEKALAKMKIGFSNLVTERMIGDQKAAATDIDNAEKMKMSLNISEFGEISDLKVENVEQASSDLADSMQYTLSNNSLILPNKKIAIGESWQDDREVPANIPGAKELKMKVSKTYTFQGIEKIKGISCAHLVGMVTLLLEGKSEQRQVPMEILLQGKGNEDIYFAIKEGFLVKSVSKVEMNGKVTASAEGESVITKMKLNIENKMEKVK